MDLLSWFQLVFVCILGAISPGPSLLVVIHATVLKGRVNGILTGVGHGLGVGIYAACSVFGLLALSKIFPDIFFFANIIGVLFLIVLGFKFWFQSFRENNLDLQGSSDIGFSGFFSGFAIAILNPKIAIFFLAIFSQFITTKLTWTEKFLMAVTAGTIDMVWYAMAAVFLSIFGLENKLKDKSKMFCRIIGLLLVFMAFSLLVKDIKA